MRENRLKGIYERAEKMGIMAYPFIKARIDQTEDEHIITDLDRLSDEDFKQYWDALYRIHSENTGGYDGWGGAHEIFERLGAVKKEVRQNHRVFVSYTFLI